MAHFQRQFAVLLIFVASLFNLNLCADPPSAKGSITCGQTVSDQSGGGSAAYQFTMRSSPVTFTTCNSERDAYLTYLQWEQGYWKSSYTYCNPSNNQYPSGCTAATCSGSHEQWIIDFLTPGTTYWIELYWWAGNNIDNYQISMQCQTQTTAGPTTKAPTTKTPTTTAPTTRAPTTKAPTTKAPTTTAPTTKAPTTKAPTTGHPTPAPTTNPTNLPTNNPITSSTNNPTQPPTADTASPTEVSTSPTAGTISPTTVTPAPTTDTVSPTSVTPSPSGSTASPTSITASPTTDSSGPTSITSVPTTGTTSPTTVSASPTTIAPSRIASKGDVIIAVYPTTSPNLADGAVAGTTGDYAPNTDTNNKQKNGAFTDNLWILYVGIGCLFCIIIVFIVCIKKRRKLKQKGMMENKADRIRVLDASPSSVIPMSITPNFSIMNLNENISTLDLTEMTVYNTGTATGTATGTGTTSSNYINDDEDDVDGLYTNPTNVTPGENPSMNHHVTAGNEDDMTPNSIDLNEEGDADDDDNNDGLYTIPAYRQTTKGDD